MGRTQYVTLPTREYALMCRLEGQVRCLLRTSGIQSTEPHKDAMRATIETLVKARNGKT